MPAPSARFVGQKRVSPSGSSVLSRRCAASGTLCSQWKRDSRKNRKGAGPDPCSPEGTGRGVQSGTGANAATVTGGARRVPRRDARSLRQSSTVSAARPDSWTAGSDWRGPGRSVSGTTWKSTCARSPAGLGLRPPEFAALPVSRRSWACRILLRVRHAPREPPALQQRNPHYVQLAPGTQAQNSIVSRWCYGTFAFATPSPAPSRRLHWCHTRLASAAA